MDAATARSMAGSITLIPPVTFTYTSRSKKGMPRAFSSTATRTNSRLTSYPIDSFLGKEKLVFGHMAWTSMMRGLEPVTWGKSVLPEPALPRSERKKSEGSTLTSPSFLIWKRPISSTGPYLFFIARIILYGIILSPSK